MQTQERYEWHKHFHTNDTCYICRAEPLKTYRYWKIIDNQFPYDEIATTTHMIVPLRHVREDQLRAEELQEYSAVKADLHAEYDLILENTYKQKSIPGHYHLHLLKLKERLMNVSEKRPEAVFLTPEKA